MARKNLDVVWDASLGIFDRLEYSQKKEVSLLKNIIRKSKDLCDKTVTLKLPSAILENDLLLDAFIDDVSLLADCGAKIFIVQDSENSVEKILKSLGFVSRFDKESVEDSVDSTITEMVLSGYVNKKLVSKLSSLGISAVGISGQDCSFVSAVPFPDGIAQDFRGFGKPIINNMEILANFQESGIVGIVSPVALDGAGRTKLVSPNFLVAEIASCMDASLVLFPCSAEESSILSSGLTIFELKELLQNGQDDISRDLIISAILALESSSAKALFPCASESDSIILSIFN